MNKASPKYLFERDHRNNFSFDKEISENDLKQENIVIDKASIEMLKGSVVDFSQELIGSSFKISNPKTKSSCGCGISFSF